MFFILSKILSFCISPFTWICLAIGFSFLVKNNSLRKFLTKLAFVLFVVFTNSFVLDEVSRVWEISYQKSNDLPKVGIVLGGMSSYDAANKHIQFHNGSDRLWQGLKLLKINKLESILVSGGSGSIVHQELKEADHIATYLSAIGLADTNIFYENKSKNTFENAVNSKIFFQEKKWPLQITLITSSIHMRRAKACFEKQGFTVTPFVTNRKSGPRKFQLDHLLLPNVETLNNWNSLLHEMVGYVSYNISNYL